MLINGKKVTWLFGESVLDAATRAGEFIPSLCCDPGFMNRDSCCRLCLVQITLDGRTSLQAACATVTDEDMEIVTSTPELEKTRETILQLIYSEAPGNKVILELMKKCNVEPDEKIPDKGGRDCILCRRCRNVCNYWVHGAIDSMHRGIKREISTPYDIAADECLGCASCAIVCPINAIEVKETEDKRHIWEKDFQLLYCEECGKLLTTDENFFDASYPNAPILCHTCSEEYRKKNRPDDELYFD